VMLMTIFFVIFGSFGIELFKGVLSHSCDAQFVQQFEPGVSAIGNKTFHLDVVNDYACPKTLQCSSGTQCYEVPDTFLATGERAHATAAIGFDDMPKAMLTLFVMTTLDEWPGKHNNCACLQFGRCVYWYNRTVSMKIGSAQAVY
jgi:hypothetical protein